MGKEKSERKKGKKNVHCVGEKYRKQSVIKDIQFQYVQDVREVWLITEANKEVIEKWELEKN